MAKLLIIDTSSSICRVVIAIDDRHVERVSERVNSHAHSLLSMITDLLSECGIALRDLDALAVVNGPGSFTGIRIGLSVVQGLAYAINRPVILMSSLKLLAMSAEGDESEYDVLSVINSRKNEVYFAHFRLSGNGCVELVGTEQVTEIDGMKLADRENVNRRWVGVGDGWNFKPRICQSIGIGSIAVTDTTSASAEALCKLAKMEFSNDHFVQAERAEPRYLKEELEYRE